MPYVINYNVVLVIQIMPFFLPIITQLAIIKLKTKIPIKYILCNMFR